MAGLDLQECYNVAMFLVKTAGKIVREANNKKKNIEMKSSAIDLVTESDKAIEKLLISGLSSSYPDHKFIGEESVSAGEKCVFTDAPTWIIDPIDGTMNFVHSFPQSCVSVGLWVNKEAALGIVYNPVLEQMFTAIKGQGAFLNGEKISVSDETATQAQKKWKGIRASYTRELLKKKAEKSGSGASGRKQYMYFEILRFLETVTKPTTSSMDENKDEDVDNGMNVGTPREKEPENPSKKSKMKKIKDDDLIEVLKAKILKENQQQSDETNEDRLFLLSLVSELQKVPADRKLQVKASILNVIFQAQVIQQPLQPHYSFVPVYNPTYQTQNTHQLQQTTFQDHGHNYWQMKPSTSARGNDAMQCPAPTQSPTFSDTSSIIDFE